MFRYLTALCLLSALSNPGSAQNVVTMTGGTIDISSYLNQSLSNGAIATRMHVTANEDLSEDSTATFQLHSGNYLNDGAMDQNGLLYSHQAQMGWAGNWGTLALSRQTNAFFYDGYALDHQPGGMTRNTSDMLAAVSLPGINHTVFAAYSNLSDKSDSVSEVGVKQYSLSYAYPISRMTNLFIARTRLDNISQIPFSSAAGSGARQIQIGLHHAF